MVKFNEHYRGRRSSFEGAREQSAHLHAAEAGIEAEILSASTLWRDENVKGVGSGVAQALGGTAASVVGILLIGYGGGIGNRPVMMLGNIMFMGGLVVGMKGLGEIVRSLKDNNEKKE